MKRSFANMTVNEQKVMSLLGFAARARRLVVGTDQITTALRRAGGIGGGEEKKLHKNSPIVLVAKDASGNTKKRIANCCAYYNAEYTETGFTMAALSKQIGRASEVSAVAVTDKGFAKSIRTQLSETE